MGIFDKFKSGFKKSASAFTSGLKEIIIKKEIDDKNLNKIEEFLIESDVGVEAASEIKEIISNKKVCMREILLLKSAFSVIDQMFHQEIQNAEYKKRRWLPCWLCKDRNVIVNPHQINKFVEELMDPFSFNNPNVDLSDEKDKERSYLSKFNILKKNIRRTRAA